MSLETLEVRPGNQPGTVISKSGERLTVPDGWALLPPGDPALSRRIKKDGPTWTVKEKKGRKEFTRGIWAPAERIEILRCALELERMDPAYERKLEAGRRRRTVEQKTYVDEFTGAVQRFLDFHSRYEALAKRMAGLITAHAVPVGSGTVARTKRIPIEQRAEAATIAWLRHQTTAYDSMRIPRKKGARREVRRMLAKESKRLLKVYREGLDIDVESCPLQRAI